MSRYIRKDTARDAVVGVLVDHVEYMGGKLYKQMLTEMFAAIEELPTYEIADNMEETEWDAKRADITTKCQ